MHASCPACATAYDIPDALIGARRTLRCATCGTQWTVGPIDLDAMPRHAALHPARGPRPASDHEPVAPPPMPPSLTEAIEPEPLAFDTAEPEPMAAILDIGGKAGTPAETAYYPPVKERPTHRPLASLFPPEDTRTNSAADLAALRPLRADRFDERAPRAGASIYVAWAASLIIVGAGLFAAYTYRDPIMTAWPPAQRLFAALGVPHG